MYRGPCLPASPLPGEKGSKISNNSKMYQPGATGSTSSPGRAHRPMAGRAGVRLCAGRGRGARGGEGAAPTRSVAIKTRPHSLPGLQRPSAWGLPMEAAGAGGGRAALQRPGQKSSLSLDTQKQEGHIKPIINILPGKNTKSIFFSEKLITWKGGEAGFDV